MAFGKTLDAEIDAVAPGAKTTYIGHSYGGSVVGTAEQLGLRADRVIYASSAGTGALDTGWHNPNKDVERYSLTAPGDPIHYSQQLPSNPHGGDPTPPPGSPAWTPDTTAPTRTATAHRSPEPAVTETIGTIRIRCVQEHGQGDPG